MLALRCTRYLVAVRIVHACFTHNNFFHVRGLLRLALRLPWLSLFLLFSDVPLLLAGLYGGEYARKASSGLKCDEADLAVPPLEILASEADALAGASNGGMSRT